MSKKTRPRTLALALPPGFRFSIGWPPGYGQEGGPAAPAAPAGGSPEGGRKLNEKRQATQWRKTGKGLV